MQQDLPLAPVRQVRGFGALQQFSEIGRLGAGSRYPEENSK